MKTLPLGFAEYISKYPQLNILRQSLLTEPEVSIRRNRAKSPSTPPNSQPVPWCSDGYYLSERPKFTLDPSLHQGLYYVQDASSMAITAVVRQAADDQPVRYLDACAAPGGKTTAAVSALPSGSLMVCNEYDYKRAEILAENVAKWGAPNVVVTRGDTSRIGKLDEFFDIVAVDAPCSGEGMMRKDDTAIQQWSPGLVQQCALVQREILANVWQSLRPGGTLIYSTCTFNRHENEENLQWLVDNYDAAPIEIVALSATEGIERGIDTPYPCYRFLPGRIRGEGLFICAVRKPGKAGTIPKSRRAKTTKPDKRMDSLKGWINTDADLLTIGSNVYALPIALSADMQYIASTLDTLSVGTMIAEVKGKDMIPTHQLALSTIIDTAAFATCELTLDEALTYLRRENLTLSNSVSRGYVLLTYNGHPLGFVKNLGNRTNSLLPKEWRIRTKN